MTGSDLDFKYIYIMTGVIRNMSQEVMGSHLSTIGKTKVYTDRRCGWNKIFSTF